MGLVETIEADYAVVKDSGDPQMYAEDVAWNGGLSRAVSHVKEHQAKTVELVECDRTVTDPVGYLSHTSVFYNPDNGKYYRYLKPEKK